MQLAAYTSRVFQQREILLRAEGRVRYFTLTPGLQMAFTGVVLLTGCWFAYSSIEYVVSGHRMTVKDEEIVRTKGAYADLLGEVAQYYQNFNELTHSLTEAESMLRGLTQPGGDAAIPPAPTKITYRGTAAPLPAIASVVTHSDLRGMVDRNKVLALDIANLREQLHAAEEQKKRVNENLNTKIATLQSELSQSEEEKRRTNQELSGNIESMREHLRASEDEAARVNETLNSNIVALQEKLKASEDEKRRNDEALTGDISTLQEQLRLSEEEKRRTSQMLTVDVNALRQQLQITEEQLVRVNATLSGNIATLQHQLASSEEEKERINETLGQSIASLQTQLQASEQEKRRMDLALNADLTVLDQQLKMTEDEKQRVIAAREQISAQLRVAESDLKRMGEENDGLTVTIDDLETRLAAAREAQEKAVIAAREAQEQEKIATREAQERVATAEREAQQQVTTAQREAQEQVTNAANQARTEVETARNAVRDQLAGLEATLAAARTNVTALEQKLETARANKSYIEQRMGAIQQALATVIGQRNALQSDRSELSTRVAELEERLAVMQASQDTLLQRIMERTRTGVDMAQKAVAMTGLDLNELLRRASGENEALGGPFIEASAQSADIVLDKLTIGDANLDSEVERWESLQMLLRVLPLAAPMDTYSLRSRFGARADPFNGRLAMHEGLDLAGELRASVLATAPGKVVFAGWKGGYGRMVEIDHGLGIHTRYAHLNSISVQVGDEVAFRQAIGVMGSTGRSTGPHVHYEVRVDGKPQDPMNFLKAGRYVFKG